MDVFFFSDSAAVAKIFAKLEKAKGINFQVLPSSELKKGFAFERDSIVYSDFSAVDATSLKKQLNLLASLNRAFGVVDPKGIIGDPAWLFHSGAADYIGKAIAKDGIDASRLKRVAKYAERFISCDENEQAAASKKEASRYCAPLSGKDWSSVKEGSSYMFSFMFFELDDQKTIKSHLSGTLLDKFVNKVYSFVERNVADLNGKVWMWNDLCGVVLFPFDGESCPALMRAFNIMFNRKIISFEEFNYDMLLTYRIAIHIGETAYMERGNTGEIISDSVNSIFHLGQKFAQPGNFYLTEGALSFVPKGIEDMFIPAGKYEGREIYRMRHLL